VFKRERVLEIVEYAYS